MEASEAAVALIEIAASLDLLPVSVSAAAASVDWPPVPSAAGCLEAVQSVHVIAEKVLALAALGAPLGPLRAMIADEPRIPYAAAHSQPALLALPFVGSAHAGPEENVDARYAKAGFLRRRFLLLPPQQLALAVV